MRYDVRVKIDWLKPFRRPERHAQAAAIVRRRSTNRADIRAVALDGLDLSGVRDALDLGCGFGFWAEELSRRLPEGAHLLGVDALEANRGPFLERAGRGRARAEFLCVQVDERPYRPDASFDLVTASYSLYFFVEALPDIARVLRPEGRFVAITHSATSFGSLLDLAGLEPARSPLAGLLERFSAENGAALLAPHFREVERVLYPNRLVFPPGTEDELLAYTGFKLPILAREDPAPGFAERLRAAARARLARGEEVQVEKDDAVFRCRGPRRVSSRP
jgi:SAM-dependent methyltransferase